MDKDMSRSRKTVVFPKLRKSEPSKVSPGGHAESDRSPKNPSALRAGNQRPVLGNPPNRVFFYKFEQVTRRTGSCSSVFNLFTRIKILEYNSPRLRRLISCIQGPCRLNK